MIAGLSLQKTTIQKGVCRAKLIRDMRRSIARESTNQDESSRLTADQSIDHEGGGPWLTSQRNEPGGRSLTSGLS